MGARDGGGRDAGPGPGGEKDLLVRSMTLQSFKGRIDTLLTELEESSAAPRRIGDQTIAKTAFGTGFAAADTLSAQYDTIRTRLETLSKLFGEQIEAMGIAVGMADRDYQDIDLEKMKRLQAIASNTQEHYRPPGGTRDPDRAAEGSELGDGEKFDGF